MSRAAPYASPRRTGTRPGPRPDRERCDEQQLLILLMSTWVLATGRIPPNRPPSELSSDELIEFWADDRTAGTVNPPQE